MNYGALTTKGPSAIDLTKINITIDFSFDTTDAILFVTTGGLGCLARRAYHHYQMRGEREEQRLARQSSNLSNILFEAERKGASRLIIHIDPNATIVVPETATMNYLERTPQKDTIEFVFVSDDS